MRRFSLLLLSLTMCASPALAMPGQTTAQLVAWGKGNAALHGFKATMDQQTAGTNYVATFNVDGVAGEFHSEPFKGVVHREYITFSNLPATAPFGQRLLAVRRVIAALYGERNAEDFDGAKPGPPTGRVALWTGQRFGYAVTSDSAWFFTLSEMPQVLKNVKACQSIECND